MDGAWSSGWSIHFHILVGQSVDPPKIGTVRVIEGPTHLQGDPESSEVIGLVLEVAEMSYYTHT